MEICTKCAARFPSAGDGYNGKCPDCADKAGSVLSFPNDGDTFLKAMHSGETFEMDEDSWDYWLNVLPPVFMHRAIKLMNGDTVSATFGFAEGEEQITAFWRREGRFLGCQTPHWNRA